MMMKMLYFGFNMFMNISFVQDLKPFPDIKMWQIQYGNYSLKLKKNLLYIEMVLFKGLVLVCF